MINPSLVRLNLNPRDKGLYESYYFRGTSLDGRYGFWLKHNLLRYVKDRFVAIECALILFDKHTKQVQVVHDKELVSDYEYQALPFMTGRDWDCLEYQFAHGSRFSIQDNCLQGQIQAHDGSASWRLDLTRSHESLFHFSPSSLYSLNWPKKKILTREIHLGFSGEITVNGVTLKAEFIGMNGHNWGTEHAFQYAYANCNIWDKDEAAYFDGFSAKVKIHGAMTTPYLSMASLKWNDNWYHFNHLQDAWRGGVSKLSDYAWVLKLANATHVLQIDIDGGSPATAPWAALNYQHPNRAVSVVKNTKFARGMVRLIEKSSNHCIKELTSDYFELETLLSANQANPNEGYTARQI